MIMKGALVSAVIIFAALLLIPLASFNAVVTDTPDKDTAVKTAAAAKNITESNKKAETYKSFRVYNSATKKITTVASDDYICGVVAAEMPALYEPEALKAQAVAAYTFACRKKQFAEESKNDYDISTDPETDQSFADDTEMKNKWGENYETYKKKISDAVSAVSGEILTYDGKIALTSYHAISSGKTESCKNVWGSDIPYLVAVDSSCDKLADNYLSSADFSPENIKSAFPGIQFSGDPSTWFLAAETTASGTVKSIKICNTATTGFKVQSALQLRSAAFSEEYKDGVFHFSVYGYGHGVGMSQNGANYMAKQGSSYKEILLHYYTGCKISNF